MNSSAHSQEVIAKARRIRLIILDVDGVLADGGIWVDAQGAELKRFHVRDGFGISSWLRLGNSVAILSGRRSAPVAWRARELGISPVYEGCPDKVPAFREMLQQFALTADEVCFMGDDLPDLPLILASGLGATVADAVPEVRARADWVSTTNGGQGAVRELIEFLLQAQGQWDQIVTHYSRDAL